MYICIQSTTDGDMNILSDVRLFTNRLNHVELQMFGLLIRIAVSAVFRCDEYCSMSNLAYAKNIGL